MLVCRICPSSLVNRCRCHNSSTFTASSPLGFVVHPYSYTRIIQQRAERNRTVTAHKFSFLTFAKVFLDRWDVYGFCQKDIFGESSSCLLVLCDNVCEKETVFWKYYRTSALSLYPCCCCLRLECLHVSTCEAVLVVLSFWSCSIWSEY